MNSAEGHVPGGNVLNVVFIGNDRAACFENQCAQALFGEFLRGPAAGDAGTDDDRVVLGLRHGQQPLVCTGDSMGVQPSNRPGMISSWSCWVKPASDVK